MTARRISAERIIIAVIVASALFHVLALILGHTWLQGWSWVNIPVHTALEVSGSIIAAMVAYILISLERYNKGTSFNIQIAAALLAMGMLDGAHALMPPGELFVWLHSVATFVGGVLFSTVWLSAARFSLNWVWGVLAFTLVLTLLSITLPQYVPSMILSDGFSAWAKALNLVGGVLLLAAALRLYLVYRQELNIDDLLFVLHCSMFGAAATMFEQSVLWDLPWWGWHVLRFFAYGVALWFAVQGEQLRQQIVEEENIRERQQHQQSAATLEKLYQYNASILQNLADAVIVIDKQGIIHTFSESAEKMFGYRASEVEGRNVGCLMSNDIAQQHDQFLHDYSPSSASTVVGKTRDLYAKHAEGHLFPIELTISSLMSDEGLTFVGVVRDISERVRHNQALQLSAAEAQQASQAKSEFLTNMSHEIRTPMNGIYGSLQLLNQQVLTAEARTLLKRALTSTKLLLTIINDILDFSKIEAGKLEFEVAPFNVHEVGETVISDVNVSAVEKSLELVLYCQPDMPRQRLGDAVRVRQVILNLVSNAVKFTHQGRVRLALSGDDHNVFIQVEDTGIGMDEDTVQRLFSRFEQADTSITRKYGGTGLGMSIVKRLVELMNGQLEVQSELAVGTCINITLPLPAVMDEGEESAAKELPTGIPNGAGKRILVAEDNEINQLIVEEILKSTGADVRIVANGELAVAAANQEPFDLVFMDIQMPVMDGIQATSVLIEQGFTTPIVALTANVMAEDVQRYRAVGFVDHVSKPIEISEMFALLHRFFSPVDH
jgi:PAS domain S-box-containing protein